MYKPKSEAIKNKLRTIDVNRLTPIDALLKPNELLNMLEYREHALVNNR